MVEDAPAATWVRDARESYDRVAGDYQRLIEGAFDRLPVELSLLRLLAELAGEGGTVVETGCGTGEVTRRLQGHGLRVVGTDVSRGMLCVARERDPQAPLAVAALHALPLPDGAVDGAVCWYVLQHVPDEALDAALAELRRVLRPAGHLLLGFHSGTGSHLKTDGYGGHPMRVHVHRRTAATVAGRLRHNGFTVTALVETPAPDERSGAGACVLARAR